jgi:simple sugar transport system ATP-binding protein
MTNSTELARMMVGRDLKKIQPPPVISNHELALSAKNLHVNGNSGFEVVKGVSLDLCKGEIIGIAGVQGNGQIELAESLAGVRLAAEGEISVDGKRLETLKRKDFIHAGIGYIPENRHRDAWLGEASILDNLILGYQDHFSKGQLLQIDQLNQYGRRLVQEFNIRISSLSAPGRSLSGGNQQKVVISRIMSQPLRILVACQPTRGLDIGATEFVRSKLIEARNAGIAVLLVSYDLDELRELSDRIAVIYEGCIVDIRPAGEITDKEIGLLMAGGSVTQNSVSKE